MKPTLFQRLIGASLETFTAMVDALEQHRSHMGRPPTLCRKDRLLMTLMYWPEHRTYAHIAQTYGLRESGVCRTIHAIENALLRSGEFTLPGKKVLTKSDAVFEVVVVDATECSVERPKKTETRIQRQEETPHPKSADHR